MQSFRYKQIDDETYALMSYRGDEAHVTIPDTYQGKPVTVVFGMVFKGHTELESVQIPDTVTDLGGFLFDGCSNLKQVDLPACLHNLWQYCFVRSGIESVHIPDGVTELVPFTFKDCKKLTSVTGGANLKRVRGYAFQGCDALKSLEFDNTTVDIADNAFEEKELNT